MSSALDVVIQGSKVSPALKSVAGKVLTSERISPEEGLLMYREGSVAFLGMLANHIREARHGNRTYFNRNFHLLPTNVCVFSCKFCSYSRLCPLYPSEPSYENRRLNTCDPRHL